MNFLPIVHVDVVAGRLMMIVGVVVTRLRVALDAQHHDRLIQRAAVHAQRLALECEEVNRGV